MRRWLAPFAAAVALAGCGLHPLYGGAGGGAIGTTLDRVDVSPIQGKSGWLMANALRDRLGAAGGDHGPALYRLDVALDDQIAGLGIRPDNSVSRERRTLRARFQLVDAANGGVVLDATAGSDAGIDVVSSEYATIAAENTALERLAGVVADRIVARLALYARRQATPAHGEMKLDAGRLRQAASPLAPDIRLFLLYGPDEAGAAEAARRLALGFGADVERVDLDGATLRKDPARLVDEAAALSLFGGARYIRVTGVGDESLEAVASLLAAERTGSPVIALAPGMRATARLAKAVIDSPAAYAVAFYEPSAGEAERTATEAARELGLQPDPGVARQIVEASGGDRAVVARELEKMALFLDAAPDRPAVLDHPTVEAIGADRGEAAQSALVAAIVDGDPAALGVALDRFAVDGGSPIPWLRALVRRLLALAEMRVAVDAGEPPGAVVKRHRVFFREEAATLAALRRWTPAMLARAIDQARAAERAVMRSGTAGQILADTMALTIARGIAARR